MSAQFNVLASAPMTLPTWLRSINSTARGLPMPTGMSVNRCSAIGSQSFSSSALLFFAPDEGGGAGFASGAPAGAGEAAAASVANPPRILPVAFVIVPLL